MSADPKHAHSTQDEIDFDAPLDPAVERVRAKLARLMAVSVSIMLVSVMAVLGAIVYKVSGDTPNESESHAVSNIVGAAVELPSDLMDRVMLPAGARVIEHHYYAGHLSLLLRLNNGDQMIRLVPLVSIEDAQDADDIQDIMLFQQE